MRSKGAEMKAWMLLGYLVAAVSALVYCITGAEAALAVCITGVVLCIVMLSLVLRGE